MCGELERSANAAAVNPIVLIVVLSESTEAWDRGRKAAHYRRIQSLGEYVLVAQDEPRLELYRRTDAGHWEFHEARTGESLKLTSIEVTLDVDEVYRDPLTNPAEFT